MYYVRPHLDHFVHSYFSNKELDELYLSAGLKTFAIALVNVFVPIYLLTLGATLKDVAFYFLIFYLVLGVFYPISMVLSSRWGIEKTMSVGIFASFTYLIALNYISQGLPFYVAALLQGLSAALYWPAYHLDSIRSMDDGREGTELSILQVITLVAAALGPVIGALFISRGSFGIVFVVASVFLVLAILPFFRTKDEKARKLDFSFRKILRSGNWRIAIASQADGFEGFVAGVLWPVFIFITLKDVLSLGLIISLTSLFLIVMLFRIGKWSDKKQGVLVALGAPLYSISWITRMLFLTPVGVFVNNLYASIVSSMVGVPLGKQIYAVAKKKGNAADSIMFMEMNLVVGRIVVIALFLLLGRIESMFILMSIVGLTYLVLLGGDKVVNDSR